MIFARVVSFLFLVLPLQLFATDIEDVLADVSHHRPDFSHAYIETTTKSAHSLKGKLSKSFIESEFAFEAEKGVHRQWRANLSDGTEGLPSIDRDNARLLQIYTGIGDAALLSYSYTIRDGKHDKQFPVAASLNKQRFSNESHLGKPEISYLLGRLGDRLQVEDIIKAEMEKATMEVVEIDGAACYLIRADETEYGNIRLWVDQSHYGMRKAEVQKTPLSRYGRSLVVGTGELSDWESVRYSAEATGFFSICGKTLPVEYTLENEITYRDGSSERHSYTVEVTNANFAPVFDELPEMFVPDLQDGQEIDNIDDHNLKLFWRRGKVMPDIEIIEPEIN